MIEVLPYVPSARDEWNEFNATARNGHLLFDRGFMEYHADRFTDASLLFRSGAELVGILPANQAGDQIHSHQGLTFGGLVTGAAYCGDALAMLDLGRKHWRVQGATRLRYKPLPYFYHGQPAQDDLYWLFRSDAQLVRRDVSSTIALENRRPFSSRRRRGAGKAEKAGLTFGRSDRWDAFWDLLAEVLTSKHSKMPVHSLSEIKALSAAFPDRIQLHVALQSDEVVAGVVLFISGRVWHAQYIAADAVGRANGALDGLFIHLIGQATASGMAYFDFGISTENEGRTLNEGLLRQKEEFGASTTTYDTYELVL